MKAFLFLFVIFLFSIASGTSVVSKKTKCHKHDVINSIRAGKSIGPITPHVGVVANNLAALNLLVFVTIFPKFTFSKLFQTDVNPQALLGLRTTAVTILAFDAMLLKLENVIGKKNALTAYTVSTIARTVVFGIAFYNGVLKSPGPIIIGVVLSVLSSYLAL
jgi:hypothetical protein